MLEQQLHEGVVKDLQWKIKIYEQRILLLQNLQNKNLAQLVQSLEQSDDYQCHCGGKLLMRLEEAVDLGALREGVRQRELEEKQSKPTEKLSQEQQLQLYETIREEIEQLVRRNQEQQIDKGLLSKRMVNSQIFQKVKETLAQQSGYIQELESSLQASVQSLDFY